MFKNLKLNHSFQISNFTPRVLASSKRHKFQIAAVAVFLSILTTCSLLRTTTVLGQEALRTITIVPPSQTLTLSPGDKSEGVLKVINDSSQPLTFTASTQDFIVSDTKGTPDFLPQDTLGKPYSAGSWIGITPDTFSVAPHEKAVLHYYVQVPTNARPGGHYAGIIYTPTQTLEQKGTGAAVQTQIGTLFSIDITGPIHEHATITKFAAEHGFYEYGPASIFTQIHNMGDLHIKPLGSITIYDMLGRRIGNIPLESHNIFPTAARDFVTVFGQQWMIGPFTAKFAASYGRDGNLPLMASVTFWVFPWKIAVVILLLIAAGVLGYMVWKKRKEGRKGKSEEPLTNTQQPEALLPTPQA